jgi:hypothetical protein
MAAKSLSSNMANDAALVALLGKLVTADTGEVIPTP